MANSLPSSAAMSALQTTLTVKPLFSKLMCMPPCITFKSVHFIDFGLRRSTNFFLLIHQYWNGFYFKHTSLQALGLCIQLGHDGGPCPSPHLSSLKSTILHTNGIHTVFIDHCACPDGHNIHLTAQYLRLGLWPATILQPRTAVTLHLLDFHHQLTLQSKVFLFIPIFLLYLANFLSSIATMNLADVSVNLDISCSSNGEVLLIHPVP